MPVLLHGIPCNSQARLTTEGKNSIVKYAYCTECPEHKEELQIEFDNEWWAEVDPHVYCKRVIVNDKPRFVGDARGFLKPPDWCPLKPEKT